MSCLKSATRDISFATRERLVQRYSEVFGIGAKWQAFFVEVDFQLV